MRMTSIVASSKAVDPSLAALFASSAGPATAPSKPRWARPESRTVKEEEDDDEESYEDENEDSEDQSSNVNDDDEEMSDNKSDVSEESGGVRIYQDENSDESVAASPEVKEPPARKRKRGREGEDLEAKYFEKLAKSEDHSHAEKKRKGEDGQPRSLDEDDNASSKSEDEDEDDKDDEGFIPVHEALRQSSGPIDLTKDDAARTVYLANVSTEAVVSKSAKRTLMAHLNSIFDDEETPSQRAKKLRFRSLPVSSTKIPKRASYITKSLLDSTTKAAQAYVIYSTQAAARTAAKKLNGSVVLQRHLRADLNAHPDEKDHQRCVYIGNLNFVDDETTMNTNSEGEKPKKSKVPADVEEGLWRTFMSKAGPVEFVRVPRDPVSRVGKGFAYDDISVDKALLLNGQKFPPMLPRPMRVTRCKDPRKTARALEKSKEKSAAMHDDARATKYRSKATPEQKSEMGRAAKLLGKGGAAMIRRGAKKPSWKHGGDNNGNTRSSFGHNKLGEAGNNMKTPEQFVFEGRRASEKDGKPAGMKFGKGGKGGGKGKGGGRPKNRSSRRAAEWKKSGAGAAN